jgi:hypothetical protein
MKKFISDLFRDKNDINEKTVVGVFSFLMLVLTLIVDLITGLMDTPFPIHQFVFDGFLIMTLGAFGIASVDKYLNKFKDKSKDIEEHNNINNNEEG